MSETKMMNAWARGDELIPEREVRAMIGGIGHTTYCELVGTGQLPSCRIGRRRFVRASALRDFIEGLSQR